MGGGGDVALVVVGEAEEETTNDDIASGLRQRELTVTYVDARMTLFAVLPLISTRPK